MYMCGGWSALCLRANLISCIKFWDMHSGIEQALLLIEICSTVSVSITS